MLTNNFYLNEAGLQALIEKIKANDNKLAELIGLPIDTETGQDFQSIVDRLKALEDADITDQIEEILGEEWPTKEVDGEQVKLTVKEALDALNDDLAADIATNADAIAANADAIDDLDASTIKSLKLVQDNSNNVINFYASTEENPNWDNVTTAWGTINTTDFIVGGMLTDVKQVTLNTNTLALDNGEIKYNNETDQDSSDDIEIADDVLTDIFAKTSGFTQQDITDAVTAGKLPQTYLLMTFDTADSEPIWVNINNLVKLYQFEAKDSTGAASDLIGVNAVTSGNNVTVTISTSADLEDVVANAANTALGTTEVNNLWTTGNINGETNP